MRTAFIVILFAIAAQAADIRVSFPALTDRQRYGLQFVVARENATGTNGYTLNSYQSLVLEPTLSNMVWTAREGALESYARDRDADERSKTEKRELFRAIDTAIAAADTNKLERIRAILAEP